MTEITRPEPMTFCWPELATSDQEAAKAFYTSLFGWTANDSPAGPGITYTMLQLRGQDVGALYQQDKEEAARGVPPHWNTYVSVTSADQTAARARELGGKVLAEPFDVMDVGRMCVIQDPTGAVFCAWEPRRHIGARIVNEPGAMCWNELATTDSAKAGPFYSQLFGWKLKKSAGPMPYTEFVREDTSIGGMMDMSPEWGSVPPHWLIYFAVTDCDGTVSKAQQLGGGVKVPPTDIPNVGRFAVLHDTKGAVFAVIRLNVPA